VGAKAQADDDEPFEEKISQFVAQMCEQCTEAAKLDAAIVAILKELGFRRRCNKELQESPLLVG